MSYSTLIDDVRQHVLSFCTVMEYINAQLALYVPASEAIRRSVQCFARLHALFTRVRPARFHERRLALSIDASCALHDWTPNEQSGCCWLLGVELAHASAYPDASLIVAGPSIVRWSPHILDLLDTPRLSLPHLLRITLDGHPLFGRTPNLCLTTPNLCYAKFVNCGVRFQPPPTKLQYLYLRDSSIDSSDASPIIVDRADVENTRGRGSIHATWWVVTTPAWFQPHERVDIVSSRLWYARTNKIHCFREWMFGSSSAAVRSRNAIRVIHIESYNQFDADITYIEEEIVAYFPNCVDVRIC